MLGKMTIRLFNKPTVSAAMMGGKTTMYTLKNGHCGEVNIPNQYKNSAKSKKHMKEGTCASIGYTVVSNPATKSQNSLILGKMTIHIYDMPAAAADATVESFALFGDSETTVYKLENGHCGETQIPSKYVSKASAKGIKAGTCASIGYTAVSDPASRVVSTFMLGKLTFHLYDKPVGATVESFSFHAGESMTTVYKIESGHCGETEIPSKYVSKASAKGIKAGTCASIGYTAVSDPATKVVSTFMLGKLTFHLYDKPVATMW